MRAAFRAYFRPTEQELKEAWGSSTIILDTNILLNLYRYSRASRTDYISTLRTAKNSLWLPHQVGKEFFEQLPTIIANNRDIFRNATKALDSAMSSVSNDLNKYASHKILNRKAVIEKLQFGVDQAKAEVSEQASAYAAENSHDEHFESTTNELSLLFDSKVGSPFSENELEIIYKEGSTRYENKVPPGYKDREKSSNDARYGDLVIWKQILHEMAKRKQPAIFVTDDVKEDWWRTVNGKNISARPELIDEYFTATGQRILFYNSTQFAQHARTYLNASFADSSLTEIEKVAQSSRAVWGKRGAERPHLTNVDRLLIELLDDSIGLSTMPSTQREVSSIFTSLFGEKNRMEHRLLEIDHEIENLRLAEFDLLEASLRDTLSAVKMEELTIERAILVKRLRSLTARFESELDFLELSGIDSFDLEDSVEGRLHDLREHWMNSRWMIDNRPETSETE